jgi:hypothetical protein
MRSARAARKKFSRRDQRRLHDRDAERDPKTRAFLDAMRDIWVAEGRVEIFVP